MASTLAQTPVSVIGSASIVKPGLTPVPSTATFAFRAALSMRAASALCEYAGYASSSVVETIGTLSFRTSSICGQTFSSDELVHSTTTSGFAALIVLRASADTLTPKPLRQARHRAEILPDLRRIDIDPAHHLEPAARGHLLHDGGPDRSEPEVHHTNRHVRNYIVRHFPRRIPLCPRAPVAMPEGLTAFAVPLWRSQDPLCVLCALWRLESFSAFSAALWRLAFMSSVAIRCSMPHMRRRHAALVALLVAVATQSTFARGGQAAQPAGRAKPAAAASAAPAPSPRNANYSIDVDLDPASRTVTGRAVVTWRNLTSKPTSSCSSTRTGTRGGTRSRRGCASGSVERPEQRAPSAFTASGRNPSGRHMDVTAIRLLAGGSAAMADLLGGAHYIAPDDGNADDRTVLAVPLPRAVAAGETDRRRSGLDRARAAHVRAHRGGRQLFLPGAVVPEAGRARGRRMEHAPVPRRHRVLLRLRRVRRPDDRAARVGGRRDGRRALAHRHADRQDRPSVRAGGRARLRVDDQPGLPRHAPRRFEHQRLPPVEMRLLHPARARVAGRSLLHGDARDAALLRRVVRAVPLRPHHDRRPGVSERGRRHGVPDALHRRHELAGAADGHAIRKT